MEDQSSKDIGDYFSLLDDKKGIPVALGDADFLVAGDMELLYRGSRDLPQRKNFWKGSRRKDH